MIFSTSKQELYWILSLLLKSFDIDIIKKIVNEKQKNELKDATEWHLLNGIKNNRLRYDKYLSVRYCRILFNPYNENHHVLQNIHVKIFHLKVIIETFSFPGFILNKNGNEYEISSLNEKLKTINYFIKNHGIYEIYSKLFQCKNIFITDLVGNQCIRSIIRINNGITTIYEYKTIAIIDDKFYQEPIERLSSLV